ncbi:hypothetical protein D9M69_310800 [compost metagenome]
MRANTADQHVVAVVQQVMGGDGGADVGRGRLHELHRIAGGDVLEHQLQGREALDHAGQVLVDEHLLAVEHVDLATGHFTVDQQQHAHFGHGFEGREDLVDAGDAGVRVGGGAGRVELGGVDEAGSLGRADVFRGGAIGEVEHHQRLEAAAGRTGSEDALAIGVGFFGIAHRGHQVGHDDGAAEGAGGIGDGMGQHGTIAQMDVPVVGTQEGQTVGHEGFPGGQNWAAMLPEKPFRGTQGRSRRQPRRQIRAQVFPPGTDIQQERRNSPWSPPCASAISSS